MYLLAYLIPEFSELLNIIGGVIGNIISYMFPSILFLVYFKSQLTK